MGIRYKCNNFRILAQELKPVTIGGTTQVLAAVMIHNEIVAEGRAASAKNAKTKASYEALKVLEGKIVRRVSTDGEQEEDDLGDDLDLDLDLPENKEEEGGREQQQQQQTMINGIKPSQDAAIPPPSLTPMEQNGVYVDATQPSSAPAKSLGGMMTLETFQSRFNCDCGIQEGDYLEAALRRGAVDKVEDEWVIEKEKESKGLMNGKKEGEMMIMDDEDKENQLPGGAEKGGDDEDERINGISGVGVSVNGGADQDGIKWEHKRRFYDEVDELEELKLVFVDALE